MNKTIRTRTWILLFAVLLMASLAMTAWIMRRKASGTTACIYSDGVLIRTVDLNSVTESFEFSVISERGENRIRVEPGRICVADADCRDQICVKEGWLSESASPIVCLPHRLVIRLEDGSADVDAVSR